MRTSDKSSLQLKRLTLTVIFAAVYAAGTIALAPVSYGVVQFRIIDALIPLSILFGSPTIAGVTLGCVIGNVYGGLGWIDIILGSLANLTASILAFLLRKQPFLACITSTLTVTAIVGSYLWILFQVPWEFSLLGVFIGSLLSMSVVGYLLIKTLQKSSALKSILS